MQKLIEETEKADDDKKKKLVEEGGITGRHGEYFVEIGWFFEIDLDYVEEVWTVLDMILCFCQFLWKFWKFLSF